MPTKTTSKIAPTLTAAAARMGVDADLLKSARKAGAPGFRPNGGVHTGEVRAWLDKQPTPPPGQETKATLEIRKMRLQCENLEEELAKRKDERALFRRQYTANDAVRADALRAAAAVRAAVKTFIADAPSWAGLTEQEIEAKATEGGEKVCAALHDPKSKLYG